MFCLYRGRTRNDQLQVVVISLKDTFYNTADTLVGVYKNVVSRKLQIKHSTNKNGIKIIDIILHICVYLIFVRKRKVLII